MSRSSGYTGAVSQQREALENALAALVRVEYLAPIARLRVVQAQDRSGLSALLSPALGEMDDISARIRFAKQQIGVALRSLPSANGDE